MRVLLIEDDTATAQSIELMLKSEGFNVYTTDLGEEGVDLGKLYDYDIILLDINLPDMSGYEVLKALRVSKVGTPILILSGLAAIEDKVKGLGFGADDYMTKPFSPRELLARTRALLRRSRQFQPAAQAQPALALQIDEQGQRILLHSQTMDLTRREYQLLQSLIQSAGRILSRDALLEQIWGLGSESTDRTVDTHIKTLRAKLRERLPGQEVIITHRGLGYSLNQPG